MQGERLSTSGEGRWENDNIRNIKLSGSIHLSVV